MRKIKVEFYANSEYSVRERLQEIGRSIDNTVWPWTPNTEGSKIKKASGCIEEEKKYYLSDYEYEKEDPTWKYSSNAGYVVTGKWKMEIVPDQEYVKFQQTPDL